MREVMRCPRPFASARPFTPKLSDSVPPDVNTIWSAGTLRKFATRLARRGRRPPRVRAEAVHARRVAEHLA
jgi:hypothetical protein